MTSGKAAQYKLFWIGKSLEGDCIFLTVKWVNKFIGTSRAIDRMIVIKLFQGITISVVSVYVCLRMVTKISHMRVLLMLRES